MSGSYGSGVSQGQFLNGGFGISPTGGSPLLNDPAEIAPGVLPPLIPSGTVGNYASFNPAKRGGAIGKALKLTQKKVSRR